MPERIYYQDFHELTVRIQNNASKYDFNKIKASRYNLIDEMVVYILPTIAGKGTPVFDDLTPSRWNIHKTTSFSNGITRIIYRNSCILQ